MFLTKKNEFKNENHLFCVHLFVGLCVCVFYDYFIRYMYYLLRDEYLFLSFVCLFVFRCSIFPIYLTSGYVIIINLFQYLIYILSVCVFCVCVIVCFAITAYLVLPVPVLIFSFNFLIYIILFLLHHSLTG